MLEASVGWAIWVTGPPGSGKTTLVRRVAATLEARGLPVKVLELDEIRKVITPAPTYSDAEREVVYRALAYMAKLVTEAGVPVLIDATAHRRAWRELARRLIPVFAEVQLLCPPEVCRAREERRSPGHAPREIYARAGRPGATVPGADVPWEVSPEAELTLKTDACDLWTQVQEVLHLVRRLSRLGTFRSVYVARRFLCG